MPIYTRQCNSCDTFFDVQCKIAEKETLTPECPHCQSITGTWHISSPAFSMRADRFMTHKKDAGFTEVLQKIQSRNRFTSVCER